MSALRRELNDGHVKIKLHPNHLPTLHMIFCNCILDFLIYVLRNLLLVSCRFDDSGSREKDLENKGSRGEGNLIAQGLRVLKRLFDA